MYSSKQIRQVVLKAEKSSVYAAARKYGIAYNTVRSWLEKYQQKKEQKNKSSNKPFADQNNETVFFTSSLKLSASKSSQKAVYLISAQELLSGYTIYCFTQDKINATKMFLENVLKKKIEQQEYSALLKLESCSGSLRQLMYQNQKKFQSLTDQINGAESLPQILALASCFNLFKANPGDPADAFFVAGINQSGLPDKLVILNSETIRLIRQQYQNRLNSSSGDFKQYTPENLSLISAVDLAEIETALFFKSVTFNPTPKENLQPSKRKSKQEEYRQLQAGSQSIINIQYKKITVTCFKEPIYLLSAYDLKSGLLNLCFTYESNKCNKALYLLYLNNFFTSCWLLNLQFATEIDLDGIQKADCKHIERMITWRINKLVSLLQQIIKDAKDAAEMLVKSFIFLVDYNLNINTSDYIHPPFVLENNISAFDFNNNTLMINSLSLNARNSILKVIEKSNKQAFALNDLSPEKLLKIYNYFASKKISNQPLEDKIIEEAGVLQLMGDLSRSESLLKVLLKDKSLDDTGRCVLYLSYGMQKFRSGDYSAACRYYRKGIVTARKLRDYKNEFSGLRNLCSLYLHQGMQDKAYRYLRLAQRVANRLDDISSYARYYFLSGHYYFAKQEYSQSAAEYKASADYAEKADLQSEYTNAITGLANCLMSLNKYKQALRYAKISVERNLTAGLKIPLAISYLTCAQCYSSLKMYMSAEVEILKQLAVLNDLNYPILEFQGRNLYINLLMEMDKKELAEKEFLKMKELVKQVDNIFLTKNFADLEKIFSGVLTQSGRVDIHDNS